MRFVIRSILFLVVVSACQRDVEVNREVKLKDLTNPAQWTKDLDSKSGDSSIDMQRFEVGCQQKSIQQNQPQIDPDLKIGDEFKYTYALIKNERADYFDINEVIQNLTFDQESIFRRRDFSSAAKKSTDYEVDKISLLPNKNGKSISSTHIDGKYLEILLPFAETCRISNWAESETTESKTEKGYFYISDRYVIAYKVSESTQGTIVCNDGSTYKGLLTRTTVYSNEVVSNHFNYCGGVKLFESTAVLNNSTLVYSQLFQMQQAPLRIMTTHSKQALNTL